MAELLDHFGKLAGRGEAFGQRAKSKDSKGPKALAWKSVAGQLAKCFVGSSHQMRLIDLAVGLGGLSRLGAGDLLPGVRPHVLAALRGQESEFAHKDVRPGAIPITFCGFSAVFFFPRLGGKNISKMNENYKIRSIV